MEKYYNDIYEKVRAIISDITKISMDELGEFDNLIELGADSFVVTEVNSHLREQFDIEIPLSLFFEDLTTINAISEYILENGTIKSEERVESSQPEVEAIPIESPVSEVPVVETMAPIQQATSVIPSYQAAPVVSYDIGNNSNALLSLLNQQMQVMSAQIGLLTNGSVNTIQKQEEKQMPIKSPVIVEKKEKATSQSKDYVAHKKLDLTKKQYEKEQQACLNKIIEEYTQKTKSSKAYVEKYRKPYVDVRNIAGFRPNTKEMVYQLIFTHSQGSKIYDIDGNEYIDIAMDFGANLFGHNMDFIRDAVNQEAEKGFPLSLISSLSGEVAELISEMTGVERVCFYNSGTEAVATAIRTARAYTQKNRVCMFSGSYHGTSDAVLGIQSTKSKNYGVVPVCTGVPQSAVDDMAMLKYGTEEALEYIEQNGHEIAAVLVEPVQSRKPELQPREFLKRLREITKKHNIVLIFDEMIVGFRVSQGGAQEFYGIKADLVTYGKICGGGMPIGVLSGKEEVMGILDGGLWNYGDDSIPPYENNRTFTGGTFCHHPLTMAASKAVLTEIQNRGEELYLELNRKTEYLAETLNEYFIANQIPIEVTYCASLFRFVLKGNLEVFYYVMMLKGIYIWEGRNCFLSDAHSMEDVEKIIQAVKDTCEEIKPFFSKTESVLNKCFPLTEQQKQMYLYELNEGNGHGLRESVLVKVEPHLNWRVFLEAIHEIVMRHELLRVVVGQDDSSLVLGGNISKIAEKVAFSGDVDSVIRELCKQPFDYYNGPLFRAIYLEQEEKKESYLFLTTSHLVVDGWSLSILYQEIVEAYNGIVSGEKANLLLAPSYNDVQFMIQEKKDQIHTDKVKAILEKSYIPHAMIQLPKDIEDKEQQNSGKIRVVKDESYVKQVRKLAAKYKCSPFVLMLSAYQMMLKTVTDESLVCVGVPMTIQTAFSQYAIIGNYDLVRPFSVCILEESTIEKVIASNKEMFADYDQILDFKPEDVNLEDVSMDILFNMDRMPRVPSFVDTEVSIKSINDTGIQYELFFNILETEQEFVLDVEFNGNKYSEALVERWIALFFAILDETNDRRNKCLEDYNLLSEQDFMKYPQELHLQNVECIRQAGIVLPDTDEIYYCIRKANHAQQVIGSYGYLYVGNNEYDNNNTGWIAKINGNGLLTLFGPEEKRVYRKGHCLNLWKIEQTIQSLEPVSYCVLEYEKEMEQMAAYVDYDPGKQGFDLIGWCRTHMEIQEVPNCFYYDPTHSMSREQEIKQPDDKASESEIENIVYEIIQKSLEDNMLRRDENLLALGVHSIKMFRMIHDIEKQFGGIKLPISELYQNTSVRGIAKLVEKYMTSEKEYDGQLIAGNQDEEYEASQVQKRMYILNQLDESSVSYNLPSILKLTGTFSKERFEQALQDCVERHELLRSCFYEKDGEIICRIENCVEKNITYKEVTFGDDIDSVIQKELEHFTKPFVLKEAPLFRVCVLESASEETYVVCFDFHHIIFDGMSSLVFAKDFAMAYNKEEMEPLKFTYQDYIVAQERFRNTKMYEQKEQYWKEIFQERNVREDLLVDYPRTVDKKYTAQSYVLSLEETLSNDIITFCKEGGYSEFSFFTAVLNVVLSRYQTSTEQTLGTVMHGRSSQEMYDMIGMFVNTVPLYNKFEKTESFTDFLRRVHRNSIKAYENADVPYERIVELAAETVDEKRNALFDILISYQDFEWDSSFALDGLDYEYKEGVSPDSKFDMEILIIDRKGQIEVQLNYAKELYDANKIEEIASTYHLMLQEVIQHADRAIGTMECISETEKELLLHSFQDTDCFFEREKTITKLFQEQAALTPEKTAIVFDGKETSYQELNQKANQIGIHLRELGIQPNDFVAIATERSVEMIAALYGVLKAGGAYVPMDTEYPIDRIEYMMEDSKPKALIFYQKDNTREHEIKKLAERLDIPVLDLSNEMDVVETYDNMEIITEPEDLMYCIYTSGTTGKPKGVMIPHRAVVNYCAATEHSIMKEVLDADCQSIASVTNMVFDIFVTEAILSLVNGMTIYLFDTEEAKDGSQANVLMEQHKIEVLQTTPTRIKIWLHDAKKANVFKHLKYILIGGEKVEKALVTELEKYTDAALINVYGPSETTVWSTKGIISRNKEDKISIGRPISNTQIYMLDGIRLCGINMPGELCIGGAGLARGYLNRAELTEEKFIENPFGEGKIYRTGDLAKWRADGTIEYLGRMDEQVKIRGFRIELAEIETVIKAVSNVQDAAVIVRKDQVGEDEIYAYIVGEDVDLEFVRMELKAQLPDYMIPPYMAVIEQLPMTKNGKLDRRALPIIQEKSTASYQEPRTEMETLVADIFAQLLGREKVGVQEGFFETGGHSLKATLAVNRIEEETGIRITIKDFFENGTVEHIAALLERNKENGYEPIPKAEVKEEYPVSPAQERIYFAHQMNEEDTTYNMPAVLKFTGKLELEKVETCFRTLINRHDVLQTKFEERNGQVVQSIEENLDWNVEYAQEDTLSLTTIQNHVKAFVRPFQIDTAPLLRVRYLESETDSAIMFDMHHIISDGLSIDILKEEFAWLYNGADELEHTPICYRDYSEWVRNRDMSSQKEYWLTQFGDDIPVLDMPLDFPRGSIRSFEGNSIAMNLDAEYGFRIEELCKANGITEFMVFLGGLMILLEKYSRQEDIVVGSPVSGRIHRDTERIVGMFGNTLALRGKPERKKEILDFLQEVKTTCIQAMENQEYPLEELVQEVCHDRDLTRSPLFDIMFVYEYEEEKELRLGSFAMQEVKPENNTAKFDITFTVRKNKNGYEITAEYCSALYQQETVEYMLEHYRAILMELCESPKGTIESITGICEEEREKLLVEFNDSDAEYDQNVTIVDLFEEQAKKTPERIAVEYLDERLTYQELHEKSNQIAEKLRVFGVAQNDFVALATERSIEMAIGIYGIMQAGGAYLPLDPEYPEKRIDYILEDSKAKVLVVYIRESEVLEKFEQAAERAGIPLLNLATVEYVNDYVVSLTSVNKPSDYIYCIYTSGTTGQPKGVKLMHSNVVRLFQNSRFQFDFSEQDVWTMFHNFNFDFSVWEFFGATLFGGKLIILSVDTVRDSNAVLSTLIEKKVTVLNQVPTAFYQLMEAEKEAKELSLRYLIFGGEALKPEKLENWYQNHPKVEIINMYGITETTVHVTYKKITTTEITEARSNIGTAIPTLKVYLLNGNTLCGIGMPGEICVAGAGVADGYMNLPELTEQRFVQNPFGEGRMYRSGDLARWLPDGNLEYLGRIDEQVKVRGFRIELGEIEKAICLMDGIKDAVALVREDGNSDKYIQGYFTATSQIDVHEMKASLRKVLPDYMVPARFMQIDEIPMTANGKLNRKVLLAMEVESNSEYVAPRNELESQLEAVFKEILGLSQVSVTESFMELGGDSIKAIRIVSKVRDLGYELKVKDLLQNQTIESVCKVLELSGTVKEYSQEELSGEISLLPIQKRFFKKNLVNPNYYNQAIIVKWKEVADEEVIEKALEAVWKHHDMLRAVYQEGKQIILSSEEANRISFLVKTYSDSEEMLAQMEKENTNLQSSFDLETGPLVKAMLHKTETEAYLFICAHHVIIDGVSWRILLEDFGTAYIQIKSNESVQLSKKTASYQEWANQLMKLENSQQMKEEFFYWKKVTDEMKALAAKTTAPTNKKKKKAKSGHTVEILTLNEELTHQIQYEAGKAYSTSIEDILVCAAVNTFGTVRNVDKVAIDMEGHGREGEDYKIALDRTVGWFTSIYPVVFTNKESLEDKMIHVKETLSKVPNKGIGYGIVSNSDQFAIDDVTPELCMNYLGELDNETGENIVFELSNLPLGRSIDKENEEEHSIAINASITKGNMTFEMYFDSSIWDKANRKEFIKEYERNLQEITTHCISQEETVVTLSDFGMENIDSNDEDVLAAFLDEL